MGGVKNSFRYVDFKCNLTGEIVHFAGLNGHVRIGEKIGCGAYGEVFRAYLMTETDEDTPLRFQEYLPTKRRSTQAEPTKIESSQSSENGKSSAIGRVVEQSGVVEPTQSVDPTGANIQDLQHMDTISIKSELDLNDCLETTYASVQRELDRRGRVDYAIKYFKDDSVQIVDEGLTSGTLRELSIMRSVGEHPNVIRLVDVFVGPHESIRSRLNEQIAEALGNKKESSISRRDFSFYPFRSSQIFVFGLYEYCRGGDLGRAISKQFSSCGQGFEMREVKWYAYQLLNGIGFLHNLRIEHRDLKPNNIMLEGEGDFGVLKIGDWGLGREVRSIDGSITPTACTMFYRPIEVILGSLNLLCETGVDGKEQRVFSYNYGINADIWSAACIIAEMITGQPLFHGNSDFQVLTRIVTILGRPTEEEWRNCSRAEFTPFNSTLYLLPPSCKADNLRLALKNKLDDLGLDLLLQMLQYNPHKRIHAHRALSHPWFADVDFRRLDGFGVTNCLTTSLKGLLGEQVVRAMEERSKGITSTSLLSHLLFSGLVAREAVVGAMERDLEVIANRSQSQSNEVNHELPEG